MILHLPNGWCARVMFTALHRRRRDGRGPYARPTDFLACAGKTIAWGRTQREALARLKDTLGIREEANSGTVVQLHRESAA